jgi:VanZ family protein
MKYYLGPVIWMGIMFGFSTDMGSSTHTNSIFIPMIKFLAPEISRRDLVITLVGIRKLGHIVEYVILSILWFYAFNRGKTEWSWRPALAALGASLIYAALDEFHQSFVPSRTASIYDVGLDEIGALLGQGVWFAKLKGFRSVRVKFFGWWFAWGVFSTIMALIVLRGGTLSFLEMVSVIFSVGTVTGTAGVIYYVRQH